MKTVIRWIRVKGKLKIILALLFVFSILFMTYQILYYTSLTKYQSQESHKRIQLNAAAESSAEKLVVATEAASSRIDGSLGNELTTQFGNIKFAGPAGILGVAPEYWYMYAQRRFKNRKFFTCFSTNREIAWSKINDDFCDCPADGSDEPSTSACMNGRFFCTKSKKNYPGWYRLWICIGRI